MASDWPRQENSRDGDGGERGDPMSMRQLTQALAAVAGQPRSRHENDRVTAIQRRISQILSERMLEAIRHALQNSHLRSLF